MGRGHLISARRPDLLLIKKKITYDLVNFDVLKCKNKRKRKINK